MHVCETLIVVAVLEVSTQTQSCEHSGCGVHWFKGMAQVASAHQSGPCVSCLPDGVIFEVGWLQLLLCQMRTICEPPKSFYDRGVFQQHQVWESPELLLLLWRAEVDIFLDGTSCGLALLHACRLFGFCDGS
jgi:hypothetical protein